MLSFRPIVLPDSLLLRVSIPQHSCGTVYCSFDGRGRLELRHGDHVTVAASQYPFPMVVRQTDEWVRTLSHALRWNIQGAMQEAFDSSKDGDDNNDYNAEENSALAISADKSLCFMHLLEGEAIRRYIWESY